MKPNKTYLDLITSCWLLVYTQYGNSEKAWRKGRAASHCSIISTSLPTPRAYEPMEHGGRAEGTCGFAGNWDTFVQCITRYILPLHISILVQPQCRHSFGSPSLYPQGPHSTSQVPPRQRRTVFSLLGQSVPNKRLSPPLDGADLNAENLRQSLHSTIRARKYF